LDDFDYDDFVETFELQLHLYFTIATTIASIIATKVGGYYANR